MSHDTSTASTSDQTLDALTNTSWLNDQSLHSMRYPLISQTQRSEGIRRRYRQRREQLESRGLQLKVLKDPAIPELKLLAERRVRLASGKTG